MSYMKQIRKGVLPYALAAATLAYTTPRPAYAEESKEKPSIEQILNDVSGMSYTGDSKLILLASNYRVIPGETVIDGVSHKNQKLYNYWTKDKKMTDEQIKKSKYGNILQEIPDVSKLNETPKPIYKKWWFWTALAVVAVAVGVGVAASGSKGEDKKDSGNSGSPGTDPDGNDPNQPNI